MDKEIELGKSIIQLAQIIMILSGFLFAVGGVAYTNSVNIVSTSTSSINDFSGYFVGLNKSSISEEEKELLNNTIEMNQKYIDSIKPQLELMKTSFRVGGLGVIFSFIIWAFGYYKIRKVKNGTTNN